MSFVLRPRAENDIQDIVEYIAVDNPAAARKWRLEILKTCRTLGELPDIGSVRENTPSDLRIFPKGRYIIVFRRSPDAVIITRILHSARNWPKLVK